MAERKPYPSDLSDEQWALLEPIITAWKARHRSVSGHQGRYVMREIINAILYQERTGCQWRYLPHDLPAHTAVEYYFYRRRDDGTDQTVHDLLRCQVRERAGRREDPSAVSMDTQTVHAAATVPADTTGLDPGKRSRGRKRGLATDVLRLVIAVAVTAANVHDNAIGTRLLDRVVLDNPSVRTAWVDAGFKNAVADHGAALGITVRVVHRDPATPGFTPLPKRWIAEKVNGTLMWHRRLVRDYERSVASSEWRVYWAMTANMTRRLTGTRTPTWRTPTASTGSAA
ncbi:IS5 family transposase [Actinomadura rubrisoli]|uniref:IS5 family transposase n=1 Tax=Actinomadura rubrisoli TaxID=2530368 RepID=A0A4R5CHN6_9ACTN|nr:IS5 family transposase [Actinomadura rubrisoli]TDD96812.1 IS5 family transposase [Actinomadura rubrisoli]